MSNFAYSIGEPLLEVKKVSVAYDRPILRDVDFTIRNFIRPGLNQGQVHGLLGLSGVGKTQLSRCIAGLQTPDSGEVILNGSQPTKTGMVGVVAQNYPLFDHLTVIANLLTAAKAEKIADPEATARELLKRFDLADKEKSYPHALSGGQRQRVAIIQQMMCAGHLLFMDEPFSGLDPKMKVAVQNLILSVASAHELNSILLTTHDIAAAIAVCDTISILGHEFDANGVRIPGARIVETYDLVERGLAWRQGIETTPEFHQLEAEIHARFMRL